MLRNIQDIITENCGNSLKEAAATDLFLLVFCDQIRESRFKINSTVIMQHKST